MARRGTVDSTVRHLEVKYNGHWVFTLALTPRAETTQSKSRTNPLFRPEHFTRNT